MVDTAYADLRGEHVWLIQMRWIAVAALGLGAVFGVLFADASTLAGRLLALAAVIGVSNVVIPVIEGRRPGFLVRLPLIRFTATQLLLDMVALTLLAMWTGGFGGALVWLFTLHMVISSLILRPQMAFGAFVVAAALVFGGLAWTDQLPSSTLERQLAVMWISMLFLTIATVNHITNNLHRHRMELRREVQRHNAILETAADGIITIDARGCIQTVNPAAERIFGFARNEMVGQSVTMLMTDFDRDHHQEYLDQYLKTGEAKIIGIGREVVGRRKSGETFPLDLSVSEVRLLNEGMFFTGILRDITDRKQAEAELARLYDELKRHQAALVQNEKMSAIGAMAAGIAHEISNPLASAHSLIQLAHRQPDRLNATMLAQLGNLLKRIEQIVRQLTQFAHPLDDGWEVVRVNDLVRSAFNLLQFDHRWRKVDVRLDLAPEEIEARWMPQAVHQVLVNLLGNALDALDGAAHPRLDIRTHAENGACVIEVADTGCGIAAADTSRVFDPFFTTKPVGRGTGLGLSISYNIIRSHGGRIDVASELGRGTRFTVVLPLSCDQEGSRDRIPDSENHVR